MRPINLMFAASVIDRFKLVNDTYGHLVGDEVLKAFAERLTSVLRPDDLCCRYGGEEFLLFLPRTSLKIGANIAERLRKSIEEMEIPAGNGQVIKVTSSFGLSEITLANQILDVEEYLKAWIKIADDHLYMAKTSGRNKMVFNAPHGFRFAQKCAAGNLNWRLSGHVLVSESGEIFRYGYCRRTGK